MIFFCSWRSGTWSLPSPTWKSNTGTSNATRPTRFFSAASRLGSRFGEPSPTSTTPGRPTARCTTSMFRLAAMAGVTVQFPRMLCSTAAAAPGCPSIVEYCAVWANRPNRNIETRMPPRTPSGIRKPACPISRPTTTSTTSTPRPLPITIGSARGLALCTRPATMRICLMRPGVASSSAFCCFAMDGRIRVSDPRSETAPR